MQNILFLSIWGVSLLGIVILLLDIHLRAKKGTISSHHTWLGGHLYNLFFDVLLISERYIKEKGRTIIVDIKHYKLSDMKTFLEEHLPLHIVHEKVAAHLRGSASSEKRGEASHFLKTISEHKEQVRKNGNNRV